MSNSNCRISDLMQDSFDFEIFLVLRSDLTNLARVLVQHLIDAERCGLLSWWKRLERFKKLPDKLLCRHEQEDVVQQPIVIGVGRDVGSFVRVEAQVEDL